jgi:hypothetical protein
LTSRGRSTPRRAPAGAVWARLAAGRRRIPEMGECSVLARSGIWIGTPVVEPAASPWSSCAAYALGIANPLITFHPSYLALSPYATIRQRQYRALLAPSADPTTDARDPRWSAQCAIGSAPFVARYTPPRGRRRLFPVPPQIQLFRCLRVSGTCLRSRSPGSARRPSMVDRCHPIFALDTHGRGARHFTRVQRYGVSGGGAGPCRGLPRIRRARHLDPRAAPRANSCHS